MDWREGPKRMPDLTELQANSLASCAGSFVFRVLPSEQADVVVVLGALLTIRGAVASGRRDGHAFGCTLPRSMDALGNATFLVVKQGQARARRWGIREVPEVVSVDNLDHAHITRQARGQNNLARCRMTNRIIDIFFGMCSCSPAQPSFARVCVHESNLIKRKCTATSGILLTKGVVELTRGVAGLKARALGNVGVLHWTAFKGVLALHATRGEARA